MTENLVRFTFFIYLVLIACPAFAESDRAVLANTSIMEVMVSVITPATNILWDLDDPGSDEDWDKLEDAALTVLGAGASIKLGGSVPQDNNWASQAEWQVFANLMTDAAKQSLKAIRSRDLDGLFDAGDALYSPCEACHLQFKPEP